MLPAQSLLAGVDGAAGFSCSPIEADSPGVDFLPYTPTPATLPNRTVSTISAYQTLSTLNATGAVTFGSLLRRKYQGYFDDVISYTDTLTPICYSNVWDMRTGGFYGDFDNNYTLVYTGYIYCTVSGNYNFWLYSDDASYLWFGSAALAPTSANAHLNNGGTHAGQFTSHATRCLTMVANRYYPIRIMYGELDGLEEFRLFYNCVSSGGVSAATFLFGNWAGSFGSNPIPDLNTSNQKLDIVNIFDGITHLTGFI